MVPPSTVDPVRGRVNRPSTSESTPTGTLMRKMYSQGITATMKPPSTGPHIMPSATKLANSPNARPRSRAGNASVMMPMLFAMADAPPMPCTARDTTSAGSVVERPHMSEPMVKITTPNSKKRTLPCRSPRRPNTSSPITCAPAS